MVVVRVFLLENTYVLDGSVFVTKTARNDTYNGLNMAGQLRILYPELDTSRTRHCGSDPSLPKIIFPRESDNPLYALTHSLRVTV